jgi:hypothetical protein
MMARRDSYEIGIPHVPLRELYREEAWAKLGSVKLHTRAPVTAVAVNGDRVEHIDAGGEVFQADAYVSALPFERVPQLIPELGFDASPFEHSPITGIHLWFDRKITDLPHATLLDRTIQWPLRAIGGERVAVAHSPVEE